MDLAGLSTVHVIGLWDICVLKERAVKALSTSEG